MEEIQPYNFIEFLISNDDRLRAFCINIADSLELKAKFIGYRSDCQAERSSRKSTIHHIVSDSDVPGNFDNILYQFEIEDFSKDDLFNIKISNNKNNIYFRFSVGPITQEETYLSIKGIEPSDLDKAKILLEKYKKYITSKTY